MTVTIKSLHAGQGVDYLLRTVAAGDGDRSLRDPLTRYYAEQGTPPGYWLGSGIAGLDSELKVGDEVAEEHLLRLIGHGQHPVTGELLGSRFRTYKQPETGKRRRAVAGFDMTFSVPKSASILWAVTDAGTQAIIADAHHRAVAEALDFVEREIVATRAGARGPRGSVVQLDTTGVVATAFDHYDSRANDPHLHTHVVISNKVKTVRDGKWRALDGIPLHHWTVAVSELHEAIFSDHLTRALGVGWERRTRGRDRNPAWEITGVPHKLVTAFSQRSGDIDAATATAIEKYVAKHGHLPKRSTINRLRQTANLTTRPPKHIRSLADLTARWRRRATDLLGEDGTTWAQNALTNAPQRLLRADDIPLDLIEEVGRSVVIAVGENRSTWRRANLYAETARQMLGWRFASTRDREAITGLIVEAAEQGSLRLTPPDLATTPAAFTRADGTSEFRPKHATVFSADHLLAAEGRLLKRADATTAPTVDIEVVDTITGRPLKGHRLSPEQAEAIAKVAVSGRQLDLLVGPAGAGKTTALRALKQAWTRQHGRNSVVGLAPSAAAAAVLAEELGIGTENTAKWLYEHQQGRVRFARGQLVIIDEATLAGTLTLDRIAQHAEEVGAKVLLVGDWAQLQSVEAGGAFGMLVEARQDAPELIDIHRLTNQWAMGAIGEESTRIVNRDLIARAGVSDSDLREVEARERTVLDTRLSNLRAGHPRIDLHGRTAVVVDDGIATGSTAHVACVAARRLGAARVVLAVPVAPAGTAAADLGADVLVSFLSPSDLRAVGNYYRDFSPTTDDEVVALLAKSASRTQAPVRVAKGLAIDREVQVPIDSLVLPGRLIVPEGARAIIVFAHGSGSGRASPRNRYVADRLRDAGLGTLTFDLLTPIEASDRRLIFDIPLLGDRVARTARWLLRQPEVAGCRLGYFGASTGAAAALWAAAEPDAVVAAIVSRGGRPELAKDRLGRVTAPTLLIVGEADPVVLDLNRRARQRMAADTELVVIPGAGHLFEEPGALVEVARLAAAWFVAHLGDASPRCVQ